MRIKGYRIHCLTTDDDQKRCGLLHVAGKRVKDAYKKLAHNPPKMVDDGNGGEKEEKQAEDKYEDVVRKLHTYFNPRKNLQFEKSYTSSGVAAKIMKPARNVDVIFSN